MALRNDSIRFTWALDNTDLDTAPVGANHADFADRNIQVTGTFDGATATVQGSNDDGATWFSLTDPQGNALAFSAAGGSLITEVPDLTRVLVTSAGASTSLTAALMVRRSRG